MVSTRRSATADSRAPSRRRRSSRSSTPVICEVGRFSAWLWGPWRVIALALEVTGAPSMRCPKKRTITVPVTHIDDVLSHIEYAQHRAIEMRMVDR
jgi:predicted exporter